MVSFLASLFSPFKTKKDKIDENIKNSVDVEKQKQDIMNNQDNNVALSKEVQSMDFLLEDFKPIRYGKLIKTEVGYCPECKYREENKTLNLYVNVLGPVFLKKDVSLNIMKPLVKIFEEIKCEKCGYNKTRKSMYIPLETIDLIEPFLCDEIKEIIEKVKNLNYIIEEVLSRFLG